MDLTSQQQAYAELLIRGGVNLQPGQDLLIAGELAHREFVHMLAVAAYEAGARYIKVDWIDPVLHKIRYQQVAPDYLEFVPDYEVPRREEMLEKRWAYIGLIGSEYPDIFEDTDPALIRRERVAWASKLQFWHQRVMNNEISWCIAGVPTAAWGKKVFPDLQPEAALERLWQVVLQVCRVDQPNPLQAWAEHDANLKRVAAFMDRHQVRAVHFMDHRPGPDGRSTTDLTVELTERPFWSCGSTPNAQGVPFFANIPTEEVFTTPHKDRVHGWVRTSKPGFPLQRRVEDAYFRFEDGVVIEWDARIGREVLDQLFEIPGARQLGEVSLVDVRSPINQSGLVFHDILYDENAASHIAFGRGYPEGLQNGNQLSPEELQALGVNVSDTHEDLMIGTETMRVVGRCADGNEVLIMDQGRFVADVLAEPTAVVEERTA